MSTLDFVKMHGLGNDFVVIDAVRQSVALDGETIRRLADRHRGIGCDQLLLVEPAQGDEADFRYRIFNADGGEVEQCGNGARCFARFVLDEGLIARSTIRVETAAGPLLLEAHDDGTVTVDMGAPRLAPDEIPFQAPERQLAYTLDVGDEAVEVMAVSMGNPHAVLRVEATETAPVATLGRLIGHHPRFPQRVNVGFMQPVDRQRIRLRVYERGVGETEACGTGACAAVVAGRLRGWLDETVTVELPGGPLVISWSGEGASVQMRGPAERVFSGRIRL